MHHRLQRPNTPLPFRSPVAALPVSALSFSLMDTFVPNYGANQAAWRGCSKDERLHRHRSTTLPHGRRHLSLLSHHPPPATGQPWSTCAYTPSILPKLLVWAAHPEVSNMRLHTYHGGRVASQNIKTFAWLLFAPLSRTIKSHFPLRDNSLHFLPFLN